MISRTLKIPCCVNLRKAGPNIKWQMAISLVLKSTRLQGQPLQVHKSASESSPNGVMHRYTKHHLGLFTLRSLIPSQVTSIGFLHRNPRIQSNSRHLDPFPSRFPCNKSQNNWVIRSHHLRFLAFECLVLTLDRQLRSLFSMHFVSQTSNSD